MLNRKIEHSGHVVYELVHSSVVSGVAEYLKAYIYLYTDIAIEPHNIPLVLVAIEPHNIPLVLVAIKSVIQLDTSCETSTDLEANENSLDEYRIPSNEISQITNLFDLIYQV